MVTRNIQVLSKLDSRATVEDSDERFFPKVADSRVEKTGKDGAVGINDGGNPGCIAQGCDAGRLARKRAEMVDNATEFLRRLNNEFIQNFPGIFGDQRFNLAI